MNSIGVNILKSKRFFALLALVGLVSYGLKSSINEENNIAMIDQHKDTYQPLGISKNNISQKSISRINKHKLRNESVNENKLKSQFHDDIPIDNIRKGIPDTSSMTMNLMDNQREFDESRNRMISRDKERSYNQENRSIASISARDYENKYASKVIRPSYNSPYADSSTVSNTHEANLDEEIDEEPSSKNAKINDNLTSSPDFITGSALLSEGNVNTLDNNSTNTTNTFAQRGIVFRGNGNDFPEGSNEALHQCYIDFRGQMQCRKSIMTCDEKEQLGLECTVTYLLDGIWYREPSNLMIASKEEWIRKHLELRTTFAEPKFENYYEDRDANTSLIRAELNTTKELKLKPLKKYDKVNTTLDRGIVMLGENNNSRTDKSILTRGTRFGTGHEKIAGLNSKLIEALQSFLSTFMYADDSDVHGVLEYWTLMDDTHNVGDSEDFALTAMEWLLLNGVDPKYITLTEINTRNGVSDIVLVIETEEAAKKWIISNADVLNAEELYPNGYEEQVINAYKYVD
jgi:predicted transglutaminase-like cysteine proteinase